MAVFKVTINDEWMLFDHALERFARRGVVGTEVEHSFKLFIKKLHRTVKNTIRNPIGTVGVLALSGSRGNPTMSKGGGTIGRRQRYQGRHRLAKKYSTTPLFRTGKYHNNIMASVQYTNHKIIGKVFVNPSEKEIYTTKDGTAHVTDLYKVAYGIEFGRPGLRPRPIWGPIFQRSQTWTSFKKVMNSEWFDQISMTMGPGFD